MSGFCLAGLPLETALERLKAEGKTPQIVKTCAPRRRDEAREGILRVLRYDEARNELTVALFADPIQPVE